MHRDVVPHGSAELAGYAELLIDVKERVRRAQISAVRRVNSELVEMYLAIGRMIVDRQIDEGHGSSVIDRLSRDLRAEFPQVRGFSTRNLRYCRAAARTFTNPNLQQLVANLPWGHIAVLIDQVDDHAVREWYAARAVEHGWSRNVLVTHIATSLHTRSNDSPTPALTPTSPLESDLVRGLVKDPYRLDFLSLDAGHTERQLEDAIVTKLTGFLAELGPGFAFVGRQVPLRVGATDFHLDLLFYHLRLRRYVVIELKSGPATPEAVGKLGFYLAVVDDLHRRAELGDDKTIGILLTGSRDDMVVGYALQGARGPMAAVTYQALPDDVRDQLPSPAELAAAVSGPTRSLRPASQ